MFKRIRRLSFVAVVLAGQLFLAACNRFAWDEERTVILVSAAASLKESLDAIADSYEREHADFDIQFNFGSSGALQKQIEQGAPVDLFLSAGNKQMNALVDKKLISESRDALTNRLVLIVKSDYAGTIRQPDELLDTGVLKVAVGEPDTVPAGTYARQALETLGVWDKLSPKLVFAQDVKQVLAFVESGNADAGLVYRTDVRPASKVTVALEVSQSLHDPIVYPFGVAASTRHPDEASAFYLYLLSDDAMDVFRGNGFQQP